MFDRLSFCAATNPLIGLLLACSQGCTHLNKNGKASDDGIAMVCGMLGIIAFFAGVSGERKNFGLVLLGVILVLA